MFDLHSLVSNLRNPDNLKLYMLIGLCSTAFLTGRLSVTSTPREKVCAQEITELSSLTATLVEMQSRVDLLESQLQRAHSDCASRVRKSLDEKDAECSERLGAKIKDLKSKYLNFKCANCKKLGLCK